MSRSGKESEHCGNMYPNTMETLPNFHATCVTVRVPQLPEYKFPIGQWW